MESDKELDSKSFFSGMAGSTEALNNAHLIARAALLNLLLQYHPCRQLFDSCARQNGLLFQALKCQQLTLELTAAMGLNTPEDLHRLMESNQGTLELRVELETEQAESVQTRIQKLVNDRENELAYLAKLLEETGHITITERITSFVKQELKLPWAWVAYELAEACIVGLTNTALCLSFRKQIWYEPADLPAPQIEFVFKTQPGESVSKARNRLLEDVQTIVNKLDAARKTIAIPAGKNRNPQVIERYVDWFFRNRITGESISHIAKHPYSQGEQIETDRKTVRFGIDEAIGLLSIAHQFWSDVENVNQVASKFWYSPDEMDVN